MCKNILHYGVCIASRLSKAEMSPGFNMAKIQRHLARMYLLICHKQGNTFIYVAHLDTRQFKVPYRGIEYTKIKILRKTLKLHLRQFKKAKKTSK